MITLAHERPQDGPAIDILLDRAFGPGRHAKTVHRLREAAAPIPELCLTSWRGPALLGSIRFWPILADGIEELLLGPLVVAPEARGQGLGARLVTRSLAAASDNGHGFVLLVGDPAYYRRFGFEAGIGRRFPLPGPVDPARFLALELIPGALPAGGAVTARRRLRAA